MESCPDADAIKRKAVNVLGRLGALYDAYSDRLFKETRVKSVANAQFHQHSTCQVLSGAQWNGIINLLKAIKFDDALLQSILLGMIKPSGISSFIDYNQPVDENTRFLYYSYTSREETLCVTAGIADQIVSLPSDLTNSTHMVTKIQWGFEILCVIKNPNHQSADEIERLLYKIAVQLQDCDQSLELNDEEKHQISELSNVTVFGSEKCVDSPNTPLITILTKLRDWQSTKSFHYPLHYTLYPLSWLLNGKPFSERSIMLDQNNSDIAQMEHIIIRVRGSVKDLQQLFEKLPKNVSNSTTDRQLKRVTDEFAILLKTYEEFRNNLGRMLFNVRRGICKSTEINKIISDERYSCLRKPATDVFYQDAERFVTKMKLIDRCNNDRIQYINAFDVLQYSSLHLTIGDIDETFVRYFSNKDGSTSIWYSSDRLARERATEWEQTYQQLLSERQQPTQKISLIYADFSQCQYRLNDFTIRKVPASPSIESLCNHSKGRPLSPVSSAPLQRPPGPPQRPSRPAQRPPTPDQISPTVAQISLTTAQRPTVVAQIPPTPEQRPPTPEQRPPTPEQRPPTSAQKPPTLTQTPPTLAQRPPTPPERTPSVTEINVLLLGETGVGKSTFINAFVNYLVFDTLQQAEQGEPVVLIPVSFLITVGDQFDEFIVKFGDTDSNENHENQGQSVTQQCKSYIFNLNDKLRLRLIDTPGMGDTRGIDQDEKNIDHILTYVNNLPHLNAICLLLKPNTSRLNVFFRSCVNQLLAYITPIGYNNIIFCFTNARSTFFAPGNTGPLLRQMLKTKHHDDIPFQKKNTFCLDSESFRYLAGRKRDVNFDDFQKRECINSWTTSVTESVRLLDFIRTREPYYLNDWQSLRKFALEISLLARPLMETLRLILYNWKLRETGLTDKTVMLNSNPVITTICSNCAYSNIVQVGPFCVVEYGSVKKSTAERCSCPSNERHFLIESTVQHSFVVRQIGLSAEEFRSIFYHFLFKCERLTYFLQQKDLSNQKDPFTPVIERFLEEEQQISDNVNIDLIMNKKVKEALRSIKQVRQNDNQHLIKSNEKLSLNEIYQIVDELKSKQTVQQQTESIKKGRQLMMEINEYQVNIPTIINKTFVELTNSLP